MQLQFLTILLIVTCFLGGVVSVTDKELEVLSQQVQDLLKKDEVLIREIERQNALIKELLKNDALTANKRTLTTKDLEPRQLKTEAIHADHEARITSERDIPDCDADGPPKTIAFSATWTNSPNINDDTVLRFNNVQLNEGDGYNSTTGTFTVPVGGDGFYYFSVHMTIWLYQSLTFDLKINGETICSALGEVYHPTLLDVSTASCVTITSATAGDTVQVVFNGKETTGSLDYVPPRPVNSFVGFRI